MTSVLFQLFIYLYSFYFIIIIITLFFYFIIFFVFIHDNPTWVAPVIPSQIWEREQNNPSEPVGYHFDLHCKQTVPLCSIESHFPVG